MKRVGFVSKLKKKKINEYKEHHKKVWPRCSRPLESTVGEIILFLKPDGTLFGYFEAEKSFDESLNGMSGEEINEKWQKFMKPYFDNINENNPDEAMIELEKKFFILTN